MTDHLNGVFYHVRPVAALAMGLRGSSPPRFCSSPPDFCIKWYFVSISKWQLSLSAITEGLHLTVKCKNKRVWRPGSARTRWGSLQCSPDVLAGFKGSYFSCLLVPRRLNFFETQINVLRNCVKRIWQKESYKPVAVAVRLRSTPYVVTCNIFVLYR